MDKANFLNILRSLTDEMKCHKCGQQYDISEVQFMQQLDGFCMIQLACKECKLPVWINFFASNHKPEFKVRYDKPVPGAEFNFEPITANEVILFSKTVKDFGGDFKSAFKK